MPKPPALSRFHKLVDDISSLYLNARKVQVLFAWQTGRRIVEEEQNGEIKAEYGSKLLPELSKALTRKYGSGFSKRNLHRMQHFYLLNPILPASAKLEWSAYVELLPIKDKGTRRRLEQRIIKEELDSREIRRLVKRIQRLPVKSSQELPPLKRPVDLKLNTFAKSPLKVKLADDEVLLDCGFFVSWPVNRGELKNFTIVDTPSYTYLATVDRVIDGDTLLVLIEAGFGIIVRDKLRLRGIDTPELGTKEGNRVKKFVDKILPAGVHIILKSHKCTTDNYGRFVADVFYKENAATAQEILNEGSYLNQQLLDEGYAQRMQE